MTARQPIATAPRTGKVVRVTDEWNHSALAFWHQPATGEGLWALPVPEGQARLFEEIDFDPTHWSEEPAVSRQDGAEPV